MTSVAETLYVRHTNYAALAGLVTDALGLRNLCRHIRLQTMHTFVRSLAITRIQLTESEPMGDSHVQTLTFITQTHIHTACVSNGIAPFVSLTEMLQSLGLVGTAERDRFSCTQIRLVQFDTLFITLCQ